MRYDITVSKSQNLNTESRPCYEGKDYTDQEYLKLGELIKEIYPGNVHIFYNVHDQL